MLRFFLLFHFLSSLVDLCLGATTVLEWSLPDDLQPYEQISVFAGDSIQFDYPGNNINVLRTSGTCDSTDSELVGGAGEGSATYTFSDDQIDSVITFAAGYWNFCGFGMIINVLVLEPPPSAAPSEIPSSAPSETPSLAPSQISVLVLAPSESEASEVPSDAPSLVPTGPFGTSSAPSQVNRADDPGLLDTISIGDATVYDWSLPNDLLPFANISMFAGETLKFEYPGTTINVLRNPSGTCNGTESELIGEAGAKSATFTFEDSQIDTVITFTTDYWNFCSLGMILNVFVLEPPPSSAPSISPSALDSEAPTIFPTLSPTHPLPTNPPTALADLVVEEAVIDWSLPDDSQTYGQIAVYARGTIRFEYPGTSINVLRYPSGTCDDSTASELIGAAGEESASYTFSEDQIDTVVTFASDYWNFCNLGMIIGVLVLEPPPSAAPSESPSIPTLTPVAPTERPSIAPTAIAPMAQPTQSDAPFSNPTETDEPTIAKKTRSPTATATAAPVGDAAFAASEATSVVQALSVILASLLLLVL